VPFSGAQSLLALQELTAFCRTFTALALATPPVEELAFKDHFRATAPLIDTEPSATKIAPEPSTRPMERSLATDTVTATTDRMAPGCALASQDTEDPIAPSLAQELPTTLALDLVLAIRTANACASETREASIALDAPVDGQEQLAKFNAEVDPTSHATETEAATTAFLETETATVTLVTKVLIAPST